MLKTLKMLPFSLLLACFSLNGQIEDISSLGISTENLNSIYESDAENELQDTRKSDRRSSKKNSIQKDDIETNYGYQGSENFLNTPKRKLRKEQLEYFGYSYFSDVISPFLPQINIPVPPDYLIGPDDTIKIILFGNKNKKYDLMVNRDGEIYLPEVGPLSVAGLSFENLQNLVKTTINSQFIGTEASITLGSLRTIDIFILGAARNPGMYTISALSTMTNALFEGGGVDVSGSLRDIKLKRSGTTIASLDLYQLLLNGDTSNDSRLMQGDVIFIEPIGKTAGINGEINRPGIYELKQGENFSDLLSFAGNYKPKASKSNSEILRIDQDRNSYNLIRLDLDQDASMKTGIKNGDIFSIYPINEKIQNAVLVSGHTQQPGFYPWQEGMRILDLFQGPDDILEMTDLDYVLIKRKNQSPQRFGFYQVNLREAFNDKSSQENIELFNQDEILFLPSLLSSELITTKLIQDNYSTGQENDKLVIENEWNSMTYLRRSIEQEKNDNNRVIERSERNDQDESLFYEYSVYDYCFVPQSLVKALFENEDTDDSSYSAKQEINFSNELTILCREQLLRPSLDILTRDNTIGKSSVVSVFGNVHFPGQYPYTNNMKLSDAINAAGGPKNSTYVSEVELTQLNDDGKKFTTRNLSVSLNNADQFQISKMDAINIKEISTKIRSVKIEGEVYFPGIYPISENQTLRELIRRAGGINEYGSSDAAVFKRNELKEIEKQRFKEAQSDLQRKLILTSQSNGIGQDAFDNEVISQINLLLDQDDQDMDSFGRLVIDLDGILKGNIADIELRDGDSIMIPKKRQSISVIGEVYVSNTHILDEKLRIKDYIMLSGGATELADEENIYLIRADGSILSPSQISSGFFRSSELQAGDTIVVPIKLTTFSQLRAATEITQIIYQMALAAAAVNSF